MSCNPKIKDDQLVIYEAIGQKLHDSITSGDPFCPLRSRDAVQIESDYVPRPMTEILSHSIFLRGASIQTAIFLN